MPRPGTHVVISDDARPGGAILDTGQAFFVGVAERGPAAAVRVASMREYSATFGQRSGGSLLADAVAAYFGEGGSTLYVSRVIGAGAAAASGSFGGMTAQATSPGAWGNAVTLTAEAATASDGLVRAGDAVAIVVSYQGQAVERSSALDSAAAIAAWSQRSSYVRLTAGSSDDPPEAATTTTLAGGSNGTVTIGYDAIATALGQFGHGLGPGQVAAPGLTSAPVRQALREHADFHRRCALLDLPDSPDPLVLAAEAALAYGEVGSRFSAHWAPWIRYRGSVAGLELTVPYSAVQAGIIARADAATGNPNQPAAGVNGVHRNGLGLTQDWDDITREGLNEAAVNLAKVIYGQVRTYGYRSASGPDDTLWVWLGGGRVVMAIAWRAEAVAENYVLSQVDGRRQVLAKLESDLRGICLDFYTAGALYGETPEEAFAVDTGPQINTDSTIAAGELHAVIYLRTSPSAEWLVLDIVKVAPDRALPTLAPETAALAA